MLPALTGGYAVTDGYSSDLSKTGEIVCSIGSTAGILFYGDSITYPDNTIEPVTYSILPYPVFRGGRKIAIQRGGGMCVKRSTPKKEYAAALFIKWFTQPEQNMRFVYSTGYLPVTKEAFENNMKQEIYTAKTPNLKKLLEAAIRMYREYTFLIPPNYEQYDSLSKTYEIRLKQMMSVGRNRVIQEKKAPSVVGEELYGVFVNF